jgi:hypothetical protein
MKNHPPPSRWFSIVPMEEETEVSPFVKPSQATTSIQLSESHEVFFSESTTVIL